MGAICGKAILKKNKSSIENDAKQTSTENTTEKNNQNDKPTESLTNRENDKKSKTKQKITRSI